MAEVSVEGSRHDASLEKCLTSPDAEVRLRATAVFFRRPDLLRAHMHAVVDDRDVRVRALLVKLALLAEKEMPTEMLERLLRQELSSHVHRRRFLAVGLLHFLTTVDVGRFLSASAKDSQMAVRRAVLQTMGVRLQRISWRDVEKILLAQLASARWEHRALGLAYLESDPRIHSGTFARLCAEERHPQVLRRLFGLVEKYPKNFTESDVRAIFQPQISREAWKERMAAVMLLRQLHSGAEKDLLTAFAADPVMHVRQAARRALGQPA